MHTEAKYISKIVRQAQTEGKVPTPLQCLYRAFVKNPFACIVEFSLRNKVPWIEKIDGDVKSITGRCAKDLIGRPLLDVLPPSANTDFEQILRDLHETGMSIKTQLILNANGETVSTLGVVVKSGNRYVEYLIKEDRIR